MESRTGMMETKKMPLDTVVIGSGNVASVVVPALERNGAVRVRQVYSPTPGHAARLAGVLSDAEAVSRIEDVACDAELYLVAVKDDAIARIAVEMKRNNAVWLHTSGGVESSVFSPLTDSYGVFYPLQTFSRGVEVDFSDIPVFVQGSDEKTLSVARRLGEAISTKVYEADGPMRARLHAAAVYACNFTNHLWAIADDILRRETGTDLTVLRPLLEETMRKALSMRPSEGQTGPARRGDRSVMEKHKSLLSPDEALLYETLSQHIMDYYERNQL